MRSPFARAAAKSLSSADAIAGMLVLSCPTRPNAPSGWQKSFWTSITTSAVCLGSTSGAKSISASRSAIHMNLSKAIRDTALPRWRLARRRYHGILLALLSTVFDWHATGYQTRGDGSHDSICFQPGRPRRRGEPRGFGGRRARRGDYDRAAPAGAGAGDDDDRLNDFRRRVRGRLSQARGRAVPEDAQRRGHPEIRHVERMGRELDPQPRPAGDRRDFPRLSGFDSGGQRRARHDLDARRRAQRREPPSDLVPELQETGGRAG